MKKRISVLGSTGSIGIKSLEVIENHKDCFELIGITAGNNIDLLLKQIEQYKPKEVAALNEEHVEILNKCADKYRIKVLYGAEGIIDIATSDRVDTVVSAIVGAAGLLPTYMAIKAGKEIAIANKETIVTAGELITNNKIAEKKIIPVDSEHSAIFQSLNGEDPSSIKRLILTASGGPFLRYSDKELETVRIEDALSHPNWNMGKKITIDSATLMNKGLEVIEAKWLFGVSIEQIEVLIHPQSIIHSMVEFIDGSVIAQLGIPDMRLPIQYALTYPKRLPTQVPSLNLAQKKSLTFEQPDMDRFPCLKYAFDALKIGQTMPTVLNASNEIVVTAFLQHKIAFKDIPEIIYNTMQNHTPFPITDINNIIEVDMWAREETREIIRRR